MSTNEIKPICTYFERTGQCRYGDRCRYQHLTSHDSATAFKERSWYGAKVRCHMRVAKTRQSYIQSCAALARTALTARCCR